MDAITTLRYGNTNTYLVHSDGVSLLFDTDYAGTLPALFKAFKREELRVEDIDYFMVSHFHPDHAGLVGKLQELGAKLLLFGGQSSYAHFPDVIFTRNGLPFVPVDESRAIVIPCEQSRDFLSKLGIRGEVVATPSHSPDSVSLVLDDGTCLVGDLEPYEYLDAYEENVPLLEDWQRLLACMPKRICYGHMPERVVDYGKLPAVLADAIASS